MTPLRALPPCSVVALLLAAAPALAQSPELPPITVQPPAAPAPEPQVAPTAPAPETPPAAALRPAARPAPRNGPNHVTVLRDERGAKLQVDGRDFFVFGMNWDYMPVGENYTYALWTESDEFIKEALDREMRLLRAMGVNAIRQYEGIPARWITYIYETWGIYTVLNHTVGRYGFNIDGVWHGSVNYQDPRTREVLKADVLRMVEQFKNTPGVLMWLLGNENNYGLHWASAEIEALPVNARESSRAVYLYSLMGEVTDAIKQRDTLHPVALANGDLQYIDLIAKHCRNLDIMGGNVYRGISSGDLFDVVKAKLGVPFMYTEFGADAYDAKRRKEDQLHQAVFLRGQWQEIFEQSYGKGRAGNAIGGMVFQWSDGWWKFGQTTDLEKHDTNASWPNDAYLWDFVAGSNNMNEEWWGICAKSPRDEEGHYELYPRAAYYVLKDAFALDPYAATTTPDSIERHFARIDPYAELEHYELSTGLTRAEEASKVRLNGLRMNLSTISTSGENSQRAGSATSFDHLESFYVDVGLQPTDRLKANVAVAVLGHVPTNPIDEIYYENRALPRRLTDASGESFVLEDIERLRLYNASLDWDDDWFKLTGFYRVGHYHWGYEGDFFGLYPEANYGPNLDTYNGQAPLGVEAAFKRELDGLKIAAGPQLWWGANPAIVAKYRHDFGGVWVTMIHQEDFADQGVATTSFAIPEPRNRKTTLQASGRIGALMWDAGVICAGTPKLGDTFLAARDADGRTYMDSGYYLLEDRVDVLDTLGAKLKFTLQNGRFNYYLQGAFKGLVADGGADPTFTLTGWSLKEDGRGNQYNVLGGMAVILGNFVVAPNVLFQKPLEGPLPALADYYNPLTGTYYPAVKPRNIHDDPFAVLGNRETLGLEMLVAFDPTPETAMWEWDNDLRENAPLAASLDFAYRIRPTARDASLGFNAEGQLFAFPASPPARDLWELRARVVSHPVSKLRIAATAWGGTAEPNGDSPRLVRRVGAEARVSWASAVAAMAIKFNDYGPYDYHRDYNLTYPFQLRGDFSYTLGKARWLALSQTRIGVLGTYRTLDENSPGYLAPTAGTLPNGHEVEVRTYVQASL